MAAGLLGLVVASVLLTGLQPAEADTVTWKIEGFDLDDPMWWVDWIALFRCVSGRTPEAMHCRRAYPSGNTSSDYYRQYLNTTESMIFVAYPDNGKYWMRLANIRT